MQLLYCLRRGKLCPKHAAISGYYNIIVKQIQLRAFCLNYITVIFLSKFHGAS